MMLRATMVWFALLAIAFANGVARVALIVPRTGEAAGQAISALALSAAIALLAWATVRWIGPQTAADAVRIGAEWLVLTLVFEFGAGHYLFHKPWRELLADYNVLRGRAWPLVLLVTATAPLWAAWARGFFAPRSR